MIWYVRKVPFHFFRMVKMCVILPRGKTWNMKGNKCDSENSENCSCSIIFSWRYIANCKLFNCVYSKSVLRLEYMNLRWEVLLYHFAPCTVSFCPVLGAKWYSWPHILNGLFQALMSLYACISFSQAVANTWPCIIHLKAIIYNQS